MRRRALLAGRRLAAAALGGCGFQLRGAQTLPIDTLFLALPVNSALGAEIARVVRSSTNAGRRDGPQAGAGDLRTAGRDRASARCCRSTRRAAPASTSCGCVSTFRVIDPNGIELIAPTTLTARRDITFNESELLAKESEEALLYRDMQSDLVRQMVTRLQGIRFDATPG